LEAGEGRIETRKQILRDYVVDEMPMGDVGDEFGLVDG
jgi:hypothetical protein